MQDAQSDFLAIMFFTFTSLFTAHAQLSRLGRVWWEGKHHLLLIIHHCLPDAKSSFLLRDVLRCTAWAHICLWFPARPVLSACEWGAEAGTWQGHREDQMELAVSSARAGGIDVAFAYFLLERTQRQGHPLNPASGRRGYSFPTPMSCFTFELHLHAHEVPVTIAGRLHDVVLWKWQFFLTGCAGGKWRFWAKTTMSLNTGAPTLELARVVSRCI